MNHEENEMLYLMVLKVYLRSEINGLLSKISGQKSGRKFSHLPTRDLKFRKHKDHMEEFDSNL
jgi:hypothetical protein